MAIKTVTLNGTEQCVSELDGINAIIVNNTTEMLYASAKAGIVPYADGVIEIKAGASRSLLDANGTVYLLGNSGRAELTGTAANVNFNMPSSPADGDGDNKSSKMPYMNGIIGYFLPGNADISEGKWHNSADNFSDEITLRGVSTKGSAVHFSADSTSFGEYSPPAEPSVFYMVVKMNTEPVTSGSGMVVTKGSSGTDQKYGRNILWGPGAGYSFSCAWSGHGVYSNDKGIGEYKLLCVSVNGNIADFYVDNTYIGRTDSLTGNFNGKMYINSESLGGTGNIVDTPCDMDVIMCAFGLGYHTSEQVSANCEWLMGKINGDWG